MECRWSRNAGTRRYSGCGDGNAPVAAEGGAMTEVPEAEHPSPLDQAQEFAAASSYQVRDELAGLIERDLLGPWDGELEVLPPRPAGTVPTGNCPSCSRCRTRGGCGPRRWDCRAW